MLKKLLSIFVVAVAILVVAAATRASAYHVERSVQIDAPVATVFGMVRDLKTWGAWSPWDRRDPDIHKTFTPTTSGIGASYTWDGNKKVGKGKITITDEQPPERLVERLEFIEPFQSVAETSFTFKPAADGTRATWALDGNNNFVGKAFSLVMNMDRLIGGDFEDGLVNLKRISEAAKPLPASASAALRAQIPGNAP